MTSYSFGDVVLVPFPFADAEVSKKRPAAVISSSLYHRHKQDVLLLSITSQLSPVVDLEEMPVLDWQAAGLLKPSVFKANLATLFSLRIIKLLGKLSERDRASVRNLLGKVIG